MPPGFENPSPALIQGNKAPLVGADIPAHVPGLSSVRLHMIGWAHFGLEHQSHYLYTETTLRSQMFHSKLGDLSHQVHADCSQWYASIGNACGVHGLNDKDYTGTLLVKGKVVKAPRPGDGVVFGPGTGTHIAMITEKSGQDWWTVGFGHSPGAPDRVLLSVLKQYFSSHGHSGVRYLSFAP